MSTFPRPSKHNGLDARKRKPLPSDPARAQRLFQRLPEVYYHHSPYFTIPPENDRPLQKWDPSKRLKYRPPVSQEKIPYGPKGIAIAPYPGGRPYDVPAHIQSFYAPYRIRDAFEARLPKGYRFMKAKSEYQHTYYHSVKEFSPVEICHAVEVEESILHQAEENKVDILCVETKHQSETVDYFALMKSRSRVQEDPEPSQPLDVTPVEDAPDLKVSPEVVSPQRRYNETLIFVLRLLIKGNVDTDLSWSCCYNYILVAVVFDFRNVVHMRICLYLQFVHSLFDFSPTS